MRLGGTSKQTHLGSESEGGGTGTRFGSPTAQEGPPVPQLSHPPCSPLDSALALRVFSVPSVCVTPSCVCHSGVVVSVSVCHFPSYSSPSLPGSQAVLCSLKSACFCFSAFSPSVPLSLSRSLSQTAWPRSVCAWCFECRINNPPACTQSPAAAASETTPPSFPSL